MNNEAEKIKELNEILKNYIQQLEENRDKLLEEYSKLKEKFDAGKLTRRDQKRNVKITQEIKKIDDLLKMKDIVCEQNINLSKLIVKINELNNVPAEQKEEAINEIIDIYKKNVVPRNIDKFLSLVDFDKDEPKTLETVKNKLKTKLADLNEDLNYAKRRNKDQEEIKEIEADITEITDNLKEIENFEEKCFDEKNVREELNKLSDPNTAKEDLKDYNLLVFNITNRMKNSLGATIREIENADLATSINKVTAKNNEKANEKGQDEQPKEKNDSNTKKKNGERKEDKPEQEYEDDYIFEQDYNILEEFAVDPEGNVTQKSQSSAEDDDELEDDDEKTFGQKVKEKLAQVGNALSKQKRKIAAIAGGVILGASIFFIAKAYSNSVDKSKTDTDNLNNASASIDSETTEIGGAVKQLVDKGYNEYYAGLMIQNFDPSVVDALLARPYIAAVENYVSVSDFAFNLDYIEDYEQARTTYNLTSEDTIDYVNRAHQIFDLKFFDEAKVLDIVEVIKAIDNKDLMTRDNVGLVSIINTKLNRLTDNYLFGTVKAEEAAKVDALKYFAREDTDLYKFLNRFAFLSKGILEKPDDAASKDQMYKFLNIFATSLNGFTNVKESLVTDTEFDADAQVNDYYDWYMAYNAFIAPLYPTYSYDQNFIKLYDLQDLMLTALNGPEFEQYCGQSRTLDN